MLEVNNMSSIKPYQSKVNFKSDNTRYASKNTQLAPYEAGLIQDDFDRIKKEQKKQK